MQQEDDDDARPGQDAPAAGGGVKIVRKLGPQKKAAPAGAKQEQFAKKIGGADNRGAPASNVGGGGASGAGFTENDIEFMKKAI